MITFEALMRTVRNHPVAAAIDLMLLSALMIGATLMAIEYDLLTFWYDLTPKEKRIKTEEAFILAALLFLCLSVFVARRAAEERHDNVKWQRVEAQLRQHKTLSQIDPLTSLPNRRAFVEALEEINRTGTVTAIYVLDLNGFKNVNDVHGHAEGYQVLRVVGDRFRLSARLGDIVARLGGDEFAVIARGVGPREEADLAMFRAKEEKASRLIFAAA
jgi:GGDEF domain-containing protein